MIITIMALQKKYGKGSRHSLDIEGMPTALLRKGAVTAILGMEGCMSKRRPPPFLERVWIPLYLWREAVHLSLSCIVLSLLRFP